MFAQPLDARGDHRCDRVVFIVERLEMDQLAEWLMPMIDIAAIDDCGNAGDQAVRMPRAEWFELQVRGEEAAAREQIDLVLHIGRPPRVAIAVDLKRKTRELLQLFATRWTLDSNVVAGHGTLALRLRVAGRLRVITAKLRKIILTS